MAVNPDSLPPSWELGREVKGRLLLGFWCWDWLFVRERTFLPGLHSLPSSLPPSFPLSLSPSLRVSLPSDQHQLHQATAARLVLLGLDVVVYLELGLVGLLRRSVLQLPDRETRQERGSWIQRRWMCGMQHRQGEQIKKMRREEK